MVDLLNVELEFFALKDVSVGSAALSRAGADSDEESLVLELLLHLDVDDSLLVASVELLLKGLGLLDFLGSGGLVLR